MAADYGRERSPAAARPPPGRVVPADPGRGRRPRDRHRSGPGHRGLGDGRAGRRLPRGLPPPGCTPRGRHRRSRVPGLPHARVALAGRRRQRRHGRRAADGGRGRGRPPGARRRRRGPALAVRHRARDSGPRGRGPGCDAPVRARRGRRRLALRHRRDRPGRHHRQRVRRGPHPLRPRYDRVKWPTSPSPATSLGSTTSTPPVVAPGSRRTGPPSWPSTSPLVATTSRWGCSSRSTPARRPRPPCATGASAPERPWSSSVRPPPPRRGGVRPRGVPPSAARAGSLLGPRRRRAARLRGLGLGAGVEGLGPLPEAGHRAVARAEPVGAAVPAVLPDLGVAGDVALEDPGQAAHRPIRGGDARGPDRDGRLTSRPSPGPMPCSPPGSPHHGPRRSSAATCGSGRRGGSRWSGGAARRCCSRPARPGTVEGRLDLDEALVVDRAEVGRVEVALEHHLLVGGQRPRPPSVHDGGRVLRRGRERHGSQARPRCRRRRRRRPSRRGARRAEPSRAAGTAGPSPEEATFAPSAPYRHPWNPHRSSPCSASRSRRSRGGPRGGGSGRRRPGPRRRACTRPRGRAEARRPSGPSPAPGRRRRHPVPARRRRCGDAGRRGRRARPARHRDEGPDPGPELPQGAIGRPVDARLGERPAAQSSASSLQVLLGDRLQLVEQRGRGLDRRPAPVETARESAGPSGRGVVRENTRCDAVAVAADPSPGRR